MLTVEGPRDGKRHREQQGTGMEEASCEDWEPPCKTFLELGQLAMEQTDRGETSQRHTLESCWNWLTSVKKQNKMVCGWSLSSPLSVQLLGGKAG